MALRARTRPNRDSEVALFLGAGASVPLGFPTTAGILPLILDRLEKGDFQSSSLREDGARLRSFLLQLFPGMARDVEGGVAAVPPVTDILSLLDHCIASGESLMHSDNDLTVPRARYLLERSILEVLLEPSATPRMKCSLVSDWLRARAAERTAVSIITTNYDFGLDSHLLTELFENWDEQYHEVDFGFSWRTIDSGEVVAPARDARLRLYKLHGSLNWLRCDLCGFIYVNFSSAIASIADEDFGSATNCHCGRKTLSSVLVTPSYVRSVRERSLLSTWQHAGEALRRADRWIFVGYSLPAEDVAIRSMILRARAARASASKPPSVDVVQFGDDVETERRYRLLFPTNRYSRDGFAAFLAGTARWV